MKMKRYNNYRLTCGKPVAGSKPHEVGTPVATERKIGEELFDSVQDNSSRCHPETGNMQQVTCNNRIKTFELNNKYSLLTT